MMRLGDVATYINGFAFKPDDWSEEGLPIIRIQDLTGNSYQMNRYAGDYNPKYEVNRGDVLISWSASLGVYVWQGEKALLNQHIFKVIFDKCDVDKSFYVHQVAAILEKAASQAHGATMKHLTKPVFDALPFYLPDLPTQQRIADTLDKVSEGIGLCRKMLGKLDLMVKAKFGEMFGNIPETEFVTMGSVCSLITDGTHQPPKFVDSGIPFLFVSNITTNMLTYNAEKFISAETYAELMKRTPVEIGDILLSTVGSYGHPAIVKSNKQFSFQRHIAFLKPRHNIIDSTFLHSAILTAGVQRQIEAKVKGIAQKTLNLSEIRTLRFPLPPLQEQERYAALVKNINKSKLTIQEIRDKMETEKLALMQEYFG